MTTMVETAVGSQLRRASVTRLRARIEIAVWFGVLVLAVVLSFVLGPTAAATAVVGRPLEPPSGAHLFGLDTYGMDVALRVINAARLDIGVAVAAGVVVFVVAYPIALATGFWNTWWTKLILRILDVFQSFPSIVLALTVVALTGNGVGNLVAASAFVFAPVFVRTVRAVVLSVREQVFVEAALATGVRPFRVLVRHVVPHTIGAAMAQTTIAVSRTIILVAGLSFIGVGVQPPTPEWGSMVQAGVAPTLNGNWWAAVFPGLAIVLTVMVFDRIGTLLGTLTLEAER
jgi:peptide/nickel transport system permease protein